MKYLKLLALVLLAWAITYAGTLTLSLRSVGGAPATIATHMMLPGWSSFRYVYEGKTYTATHADLDKYKARERATPLPTLLSQAVGVDTGVPGAYLLYLWLTHALPWLALLLTLWLLNIASGIKRLADALE
ncbi:MULTISPECIES: hypothetical protein [unclassified Thiomonas]|jgi:hypothetical protein|uniref:hypothetical protein n=1 Tax=unclassified Thiomonas TaxID=2625466 RepID=UPI000BD306F8|nr:MULTISPECIES: hypothetical protein [unclassified Thiomonas]OZB72191.1 MAG: hypothetical protein B7X30_00975 [Thiomonas sp. 13-64-67]